MYVVPVYRSYMLYKYMYNMACTAYSCQAMSTEPRSEEPDGERARLSKRVVTDAALKIADADGLDALTIRKLAQDLGVTPMALYWHFRNKEDLLGRGRAGMGRDRRERRPQGTVVGPAPGAAGIPCLWRFPCGSSAPSSRPV